MLFGHFVPTVGFSSIVIWQIQKYSPWKQTDWFYSICLQEYYLHYFFSFKSHAFRPPRNNSLDFILILQFIFILLPSQINLPILPTTQHRSHILISIQSIRSHPQPNHDRPCLRSFYLILSPSSFFWAHS